MKTLVTKDSSDHSPIWYKCWSNES